MSDPMRWKALEAWLVKRNASPEAVEVARLAYLDGIFCGLWMLGQTTTERGMVMEWNEYYPEAEKDFDEAKRKYSEAHPLPTTLKDAKGVRR